MVHENKIAVGILIDQYADYPQNAWHYDQEYKMLVQAIELTEKNQEDESILNCDLSGIEQEHKDLIIENLNTFVSKACLSVFMCLGLKEGIKAEFVNDLTGEKYLFSFLKKVDV